MASQFDVLMAKELQNTGKRLLNPNSCRFQHWSITSWLSAHTLASSTISIVLSGTVLRALSNFQDMFRR